ncbi:MAG: IS200/IS605 family transposase [bacterium]
MAERAAKLPGGERNNGWLDSQLSSPEGSNMIARGETPGIERAWASAGNRAGHAEHAGEREPPSSPEGSNMIARGETPGIERAWASAGNRAGHAEHAGEREPPSSPEGSNMIARGETPGVGVKPRVDGVANGGERTTLMSHSLCSVTLHLVFSTKDRRRVFRTQEMRDATSAYITGVMKHLGCPLIRIATVVDHVHVLYQQNRTAPISEVVGAVKRESSEWIKSQPWARLNADFAQFHWQGGYGIFSVSEARIGSASTYIDGQAEHHKRVTFQDEYRAFLKRHNITFDERYVWE